MKKKISLLPSILTLGNFISGFIATVLCVQSINLFALAKLQKSAELQSQSDSLFMWACYVIFFAMIFDVLDGRVARMTGSACRFGGELDSLADCCSFGVAPSLIMATWWITVQPDSAKWWSYVMICGIVFASCAVLRLARYNVEMDTVKKNYFTGLPSPGAAGAVVSTVILCHQNYVEVFWLKIYKLIALGPLASYSSDVLLMYLLGTYLLLIGLLMVSRYRFAHLANKMLTGRKRFTYLVATIFIVFLLYQSTQEVLFLAFNGYVVISLISNLRRRPLVEAVGGLAPEEDTAALAAVDNQEQEAGKAGL